MSARSDLRTVRTELSALNERLRYPDDTPWWVEVLGVVCVIGIAARSSIHVMTALVLDQYLPVDLNPRVANPDVTASSPVDGVREHWRVDVVARYVVFVAGLGGWSLFVGVDRPHVLQDVIVAVNLAVLLADPVLFAIARGRERLESPTETPTPTVKS